MKNTTYSTICQYIQSFPAGTRKKLAEMRVAIQEAAPKATEKISYQIPTFFQNGNLVHFAGYENHIGFYPGANGIREFQKDIKAYKSAKGSVQFPLDQPLPLALVKKIVRFRVKENMLKPLRRERG